MSAPRIVSPATFTIASCPVPTHGWVVQLEVDGAIYRLSPLQAAKLRAELDYHTRRACVGSMLDESRTDRELVSRGRAIARRAGGAL